MLKIPESKNTDLKQFVAGLESELGNDLLSVLAYGRWLRNDPPDPDADRNLMIVVSEISTDCLDKITSVRSATLQEPSAWHLLTLSKADLTSSTDVFPIKFIGIQRRHCLLHGDDVLKDLNISREHLRFRCEQEIKNLMLRLRYQYINRNHNEQAMRISLRRAYHSLMSSLAVLVELKTGSEPVGQNDVLAGAETLGISVPPLKRFAVQDVTNIKKLYDEFMSTVRQAANIADQA